MKPQKKFLVGRVKRVFVLAAADYVYIFSILSFTSTIYLFYIKSEHEYNQTMYLSFFILPILVIIINSLSRLYHGSLLFPGFPINRIEEIRRLFLSTTFGFMILYLFMFLSRTENNFSRAILICSWFVSIMLFPCMRFVVRYYLKKNDLVSSHAIIAGAGKTGIEVAEEITISSYYGFKVIGFLDDNMPKGTIVTRDIPVLGKLEDAISVGEANSVDYIICTIPISKIDSMTRDYIKKFKYVLFVITNQALPISSMHMTSVGFLGGFEFQNQLQYVIPRCTKFIIETIAAIVAILCLSPVLIILAIMVKVSSRGPIFYVANRLGKDGKAIKVFKFRTMYQDAEQRLEELLSQDPELRKEWEENFKLKVDPRVTPIGDFMRKTSLDELPQFANVITGTMSIIGPRPIVDDEIAYYGENYEYLKQVSPGITGLWQVSGRSDVSYEQRVSMDVYYALNWSIWLDYYIFFKTIIIIFQRKGAC